VLNPDVDIPKKYKLKEHHFRDFLREECKNASLIFDKSVGESKKRPDVRLPFEDYNIIVELDEHQHRGYNCENKRMMEIFQDLGKKPLVILRVNPDSYTDKSGKKVPGCFMITKTVGWKKDEKEWKRRMDILKKQIDYYTGNKPTKEVHIIPLFYDEAVEAEI
jgi:hypothetical protein